MTVAEEPHHTDLSWFARQLATAASADGTPRLLELVRAFELARGWVAAREEEQRSRHQSDTNVLLALEEVAKEQAAALAQQNEELRRHKAALEVRNEALRRQNEELDRASRLKSEFLATMSHELRTPLNGVIGFSELLLELIPGPLTDEQVEHLGTIHRSGQHLLQIINDLLEMAKIDAGKMEFQTVQLDLGTVVREAVEIARPMALRLAQRLELQEPHPVPCVGDPQRIRQIALNLLSNAVKFTPRGGQITVTVRATDTAELVVRDQGIGIDPAHHQLIFEPFRQIDGSLSRQFQGTGLGLALVKKFCEAMGGGVVVSSRLGEGATFAVRLPLVRARLDEQ